VVARDQEILMTDTSPKGMLKLPRRSESEVFDEMYLENASHYEPVAAENRPPRDKFLHLRAPDSTADNGERVIKSLSCALDAAAHGHVLQCAEALRLALGLLGLSSTNRPTGSDWKRRRVQALQQWRLKRVTEYIDAHLSESIRLSDLAAVAGQSRMHFASQFRAATGLRPHEFLLRRRIVRSEELLRHTTIAIVEIALAVGFQTQAHFTTVFKRLVGCPPHKWRALNQMPDPRKGSPAMRIRWQIA
jgi:AraC family transcriptional regulator